VYETIGWPSRPDRHTMIRAASVLVWPALRWCLVEDNTRVDIGRAPGIAGLVRRLLSWRIQQCRESRDCLCSDRSIASSSTSHHQLSDQVVEPAHCPARRPASMARGALRPIVEGYSKSSHITAGVRSASR
jgi:hypothetical protein